MSKIIIFTFLCFFLLNTSAQERVSIKLQVIECKTKESLPFANIISQKRKTGTASNFDGLFTFKTTEDDTLKVSFIGFEPKIIPVIDYRNSNFICLTPKALYIEGVTVSAKSTFLYELVNSCRKNKLTKKVDAKTYFLLKSSVNNKQVELVEAYYNGSFQDHNIIQLNLKIGRIYLSKFDNSIFVSMGTSNGINLHKTFDFNLYFPGSPLEWNKNRLLKKFELNFREKFRQENKSVYVIDFIELRKGGNFFGTMWIDSTNQFLMKIKLQNKSGKNSPFAPIGDAEEINKINFDITKTFQLESGINSIKSIDFNYNLHYQRSNNQLINVETKAVLFAYDTDQRFVPPFFEKSYQLNDYQGISIAPYNSFFWTNNNEFTLTAKESEKKLFIESNSTNLIDSFSYNPTNNKMIFNEPTYRKWSTERIQLVDVKDNFRARKQLNVHLRYNLDVKIFMDINQTEDSTNVQLATILDPFTSYSNLNKTTISRAFVNMYFDMVEIKKRQLETSIQGISDIKQITKLYTHANTELIKYSKEYFSETAGGTNKRGMMKWNEYIYKNLRIDNLELFKVEFKY